MYQDGTRRFSESQAARSLRTVYDRMVIKRDRDGWESIGVAIEKPLYQHPRQGFLNYDGTMAARQPAQPALPATELPRPRRPLRAPA